MLHSHFNLSGECLIKILNKDNTVKEVIGPQRNFITSRGLSMLTDYAIADCFRFVSLGYDDTANTAGVGVGNWGTWRLGIPSQYAYIGSRTSFYDNTTSQYLSCSWREKVDGISLTRAWRIPVGAENFFTASHSFKEIAFSPGRPPETGVSSVVALERTDTNRIQISNFSAINQRMFYFVTDGTRTVTAGELVNKIVVIDNNLASSQGTWVGHITDNGANYIVTQFVTPNDYLSDATNCYFKVYDLLEVCYNTQSDLWAQSVNGKDCSVIPKYYYTNFSPVRDMCDSTGAFSRIVRDIVVNQDEALELYYTVHATVDTGISSFIVLPNNTRGGNKNTNWQVHPLSGVCAPVHHGLKYLLTQSDMSPPTAPWGDGIQQAGGAEYLKYYEVGESYIGPWGCPLEPFMSIDHLQGYLTTDNLQFYTNATDGGKFTENKYGYTGSLSGLMLFRQTPFYTNIDYTHYNIRRLDLDDTLYSQHKYPKYQNFLDEVTATEGANLDEVLPGFTVLAYDTTRPQPVSVADVPTPSVRTRSITRALEFRGNAGDGAFNYSPVRGAVLCWVEPTTVGENVRLPYLDCLFTDSGNARTIWDEDQGYFPPDENPIKPQLINTPQLVPTGHDTDHLGVVRNSFGQNSYSYWYYLEGPNPFEGGTVTNGSATLTLGFTESWSSPGA